MLRSAKSTFFAATNSTFEYLKGNPGSAIAMGVGASMIVAPVVVAPAIAAAGFGANGVAAGSAAAGVQSMIGNVAANSAFATLQSYGAGGGVAVVHGVVQNAGAVVAAAGPIKDWLYSQGDGDNGDENDERSNGEAMAKK